MAKVNKPATLPAYDDAKMIRKYDNWPAWPCLPLKRNNNSLENKNLGILLADAAHDAAVRGAGKFVVYHVYMFALPTSKEEWAKAPRTEYDTVEAMLQDGWIVD